MVWLVALGLYGRKPIFALLKVCDNIDEAAVCLLIIES